MCFFLPFSSVVEWSGEVMGEVCISLNAKLKALLCSQLTSEPASVRTLKGCDVCLPNWIFSE